MNPIESDQNSEKIVLFEHNRFSAVCEGLDDQTMYILYKRDLYIKLVDCLFLSFQVVEFG